MVKKKIVKAAGRFGARYGQRVRRKIAEIESKQRKKQICPFCEKMVKRVSRGIWQCKNCKKRFAGHAYYLEKGSIIVKKSQVIEQKKEAKESKDVAKKENKKKLATKTPAKSAVKKPAKKTTKTAKSKK